MQCLLMLDYKYMRRRYT